MWCNYCGDVVELLMTSQSKFRELFRSNARDKRPAKQVVVEVKEVEKPKKKSTPKKKVKK